jgi:hypothetical protein
VVDIFNSKGIKFNCFDSIPPGRLSERLGDLSSTGYTWAQSIFSTTL